MKRSYTRHKPMRAKCDFAGGVRGKYVRKYAEGTNIVVLDPEVQDVFPDSKSASRALRELARLVRSHAK